MEMGRWDSADKKVHTSYCNHRKSVNPFPWQTDVWFFACSSLTLFISASGGKGSQMVGEGKTVRKQNILSWRTTGMMKAVPIHTTGSAKTKFILKSATRPVRQHRQQDRTHFSTSSEHRKRFILWFVCFLFVHMDIICIVFWISTEFVCCVRYHQSNCWVYPM